MKNSIRFPILSLAFPENFENFRQKMTPQDTQTFFSRCERGKISFQNGLKKFEKTSPFEIKLGRGRNFYSSDVSRRYNKIITKWGELWCAKMLCTGNCMIFRCAFEHGT